MDVDPAVVVLLCGHAVFEGREIVPHGYSIAISITLQALERRLFKLPVPQIDSFLLLIDDTFCLACPDDHAVVCSLGLPLLVLMRPL